MAELTGSYFLFTVFGIPVSKTIVRIVFLERRLYFFSDNSWIFLGTEKQNLLQMTGCGAME